jgi:hypothetical protein
VNLLADTFDYKSTLWDQLSNKQSVLIENIKNRYLAEFITNFAKHWLGSQ